MEAPAAAALTVALPQCTATLALHASLKPIALSRSTSDSQVSATAFVHLQAMSTTEAKRYITECP